MNAASACRSQHDMARVQALESRPSTLGSPGKAMTCMVVVVALGRFVGSIAVAGYLLHSRHRCGTAGVAHALLGLSSMTPGTKPESAAAFAQWPAADRYSIRGEPGARLRIQEVFVH